jgi:uncharacterized repeat protein (TIGR03803 family)
MNGGTVFELSPQSGGSWMEQVVHNFEDQGVGGDLPHSGLIFDAAGNLDGTTGNTGHSGYSYGKLFQLTPKVDGGWMERLLYSFNLVPGGGFPDGVIFDAEGNFYGPAQVDDLWSGAIFQLDYSNGGWTETILHSFDHYFTRPNAGLIFDAAGHLYGTTEGGGIHGHGAGMVFELGRDADGQWTDFSVLHNFNIDGADGFSPTGSVIFDSSAHLYGTTEQGGTEAGGTVYELAPAAGGKWTEKILYNFSLKNETINGVYPNSTLVFDSAGNLYGTASGGAYSGGVVFALSPAADGSWTETVLHSFANNRNDGIVPMGPLVLDAAGNIYGTTFEGGRYDAGVVFEIVR